MTVRAKLVCDAIKRYRNGNNDVELLAVTGGEGEDDPNASWSKWTPSGSVAMCITNEAAVDKFEVGKEYFLDFVECDGESEPGFAGGGVVAKFKCQKKIDVASGYNNVEFSPEWEDGGINQKWSIATPTGEVKLCITNPSAFEYFKAGTFYLLHFTAA